MNLHFIIIPRDGCIESRPWGRIITGDRRNELPKEHSTRQLYTKTHNICEQTPVEHQGTIQQQRETLDVLHDLICFTTTPLPEKGNHSVPFLCSNPITEVAVYTTKDTPVQNTHNLYITQWLSRKNHATNRDEES